MWQCLDRARFSVLSLLFVAVCISLASPLSTAFASVSCPNQQFRTGMSSGLPDCRAYELVTPADADGRQISSLIPDVSYNMFPSELASPGRDSFVYMMTRGPLSEPVEPNGTMDIYEAVRSGSGWLTARRLSPSGAQAVFPSPGGVSANHLYTFTNVAPLGGVASDGGNLAAGGDASYLGKPNGSFELLGVGSLGVERQARGRYISPDGTHVIFTTSQPGWCTGADPCSFTRLEPAAPRTGTEAVYDREPDGPTRVISLLPGDVTPAVGEDAVYQGASADGTVVAFVIEGRLYVRVNNAATELVANAAASFAGLSEDGGELFYVSGGDIFRFDVESEQTEQLNSSGDAEAVNVSADGSHVYFVSPSLLDGSKGGLGQPNLYVWNGLTAATEYVATLAPSDVEGLSALTDWTTRVVTPENSSEHGPGADPSRTTPDGTVIAFQSRAKLTGYENAGHTEIYRYDASSKSIQCVSCNPSGEPASADARFEQQGTLSNAIIVHNLSEDGSRVFFETPEALIGRDTDQTNDIYEWQDGTVGEEPSVSLISSGQSQTFAMSEGNPSPTNEIFAITPQGTDVIFLSSDALVPTAGTGGTPAIYDARVNGGFLSEEASACQESCAARVESPTLLQPQSNRFIGRGNVKVRCKAHRHRRRGHAKARSCRRHHRRGSKKGAG